MAPSLFRGMKGVNLSCASPGSTATCTSMDPRRSVGRHSTGRGVDRQAPHLRDSRRGRTVSWLPPSPSKLKSYGQKSRKSLDMPGNLISPAASSRYLLSDDDEFFDVFPDMDRLPVLIPINSARFQSVKGDESPSLKRSSFSSSSSLFSAAASRDSVCFGASSSSSSSLASARTQITKGDESATLGSSASARSQYGDHVGAVTVASPSPARLQIVKRDDSAVVKSPPARLQAQAFFRTSSSLSETRFHAPTGKDSAVLKPSTSARTRDQVVVLRVSLHCKGCEAKVKKHLSRMEGVTSFSVDFATKKVTVIGDVTPLGVLSSISKVKNAQFWPSPPRASSSS